MTDHEIQFLRLELEVLLRRLKKSRQHPKDEAALCEEIRQKAIQYIKEATCRGMGGYYLVSEIPIVYGRLKQIMNSPEISRKLSRSIYVEQDMDAVGKIAAQLRNQTEVITKEFQSHVRRK